MKSVESRRWQAWAFGRENSAVILEPALPFVPWTNTHGKHLLHALGKPRMSPLIGQFASVSECLSA